jgi:hypothetical protein
MAARMIYLAFLLATCSCTLPGAASPQESSRASPGRSLDGSEWPEPYAYINKGEWDRDKATAAAMKLAYSRIEMERTTCGEGVCPTYTVTLCRDGGAQYRDTDRAGSETFDGRIGPADYGRLCYLLESQGFEQLERDYSAPWTDDYAIILRAWRGSTDEPVVVRDYGRYGSIGLWAIQQAIENVSARIEWKAAPK